MPEKQTVEAAKRDRKSGKSRSTAAGEFVREEMHHVREGKHGARSSAQAIAIGLSKARRAGFDPGTAPKTREGKKRASRETAKARAHAPTSRTRSRAGSKALEREGHAAASSRALGSHARKAAAKRPAASRRASARKAARTRRREAK